MANAAPAADIGTPPTWDLSDLYSGMTDPAVQADMDTAREKAASFRAAYQGKVDSAETLAKAISDYDALAEILGKFLSYAGLLFAADTDSSDVAAFYQRCQEKATALHQQVLFFELELCQLEETTLQGWIDTNETLQRYRPWLDSVRAQRDYQLPEEQEKLLAEKQLTSRGAWSRLFDETMSGLRFDFEGKELTEAEILHALSTSTDRNRRREAGKVFAKALHDDRKLFTLITNTLAKDKEIDDRWRGYPHPMAARNIDNRIDDAAVGALVSSVQAAYPQLAHRYYALKAKWLGLDKLEYWDRNAPLPDSDGRVFTWDDARKRVLKAYKGFSPLLGETGQKFFDNPWLDAERRAGKDSGAFAHPVVPSVHPYLLMNYQGKPRDVMTLAHELGHGVHQVLASKNGYLLSNTPLTLAETASVFGEMLTFRSLLADTTDPKARKALLAGKVEDMLNTVVRQIAFHSFEHEVHTRRRDGELSTDTLCDIWMQTQRDSLGEAVNLVDEYRMFWAYIPHFLHSPFYVYAYAFGDCLVNALYAVYEHSSAGFAEKYHDLLAAGGTKLYDEALKPFGLDAKSPDFWNGGLKMIAGFIDELEKL